MNKRYTDEDTRRVLDQDINEVHQHFAHLAAQQQDAVRKAIENLRSAGSTTEQK